MLCYNCNKEYEKSELPYIMSEKYGFCQICTDRRNKKVKEYKASDEYKVSCAKYRASNGGKLSRKKYIKKRKKLDREFILDYKMGKGCSVCGYNKCGEALHLHHLNPKDKTTEISRMVAQRYSRERIEQELDKCVVMCANCHAEQHYADRIGHD
jgi:hypothetical protein